MSDEPETVTIDEVAKSLRMSRRQVSRLIAAGDLKVYRHPLFKKGARVRVSRQDVEALAAKLTPPA